MDLNINRWRVELSDHESESYLDEDFDNSLFSSFAVPYFPSWRPSTKLNNLKINFDKNVLTQFPCVPCSYCSHLQYPKKAKWELYNETYQYPLEKVYQNNSQIKLVFHPDESKPKRIATCSSCYNSNNRLKIPIPDPIPDEIQN
ncbi:unnamed protein product [Rhizophagus irregularis]|nr:unnamed protein product [Rhizophagus irregularis]